MAEKPQARWWFYPLMLGVTALLCLFVAEVAARLLWSGEHPARPRTYTFNRETGLLHLPGAYQLPLVLCEAGRQPECENRLVRYTVNADGWRGARDFRQPAGKPLVVILGDSQIEGQPVDDDQLATVRLEQLLKPHHPDAEVRSVAIHSAGFVHYYALWRKFVAQMKPDVLVVAAVGANDFRNCSTKLETFHAMRPHYATGADGRREAHFEPAPQPQVSGARRFISRLLDRLEIARFWRWRQAIKEEEARFTNAGGVELPPDLKIYEDPPAPDYAEAAALGREWLARLIVEAQAAGTKVVVVALPWRDEALDDNWKNIEQAYAKTGNSAQLVRTRPENIIRETALANRAAFLSFADAVHRLPSDRQRALWYVKTDLHLTAAGQQFLAEQLALALR
jgi:lysophospholipase L1-like esterase